METDLDGSHGTRCVSPFVDQLIRRIQFRITACRLDVHRSAADIFIFLCVHGMAIRSVRFQCDISLAAARLRRAVVFIRRHQPGQCVQLASVCGRAHIQPGTRRLSFMVLCMFSRIAFLILSASVRLDNPASFGLR